MTDASSDFDHPDELLSHLWTRLVSAVSDRASGFHVATLCTLGAEGAPSARSIILREVDPQARQILFHTDARSPKVQELQRDPRVALLFWDSMSKTQLRVSGAARVHVDDAATRAFIEKSRPGSLAVYRNVLAPSQPIASPAAALQSDQPLLENLAVVRIQATSIEWLWLDESGHRRCRFTFDGPHTAHQWLVP